MAAFIFDGSTVASIAQNHGFDGVAELPRVLVQTSVPNSKGRVVTINRGDDLQSKLNSLNCGDTAVLQTGVTWTGNFKLPFRSCDDQHWIVIQSSALDKLPPMGTRIGPADAPNMPRILTQNSQPAIDTAATGDGRDLPVNHYRLIGIEIGAVWDTRNPPHGADPEIYIIANFGIGGTAVDKYPHHILIDRCYIHGARTNEVRHGVRFTASHFTVINSYISDIHRSGRDSTAISSDFSQGPIKIVNNYLEAAGENILFGGTDPPVHGSIPSDIEVRQNYFFKQLSWKQGSANYLGIRWTLKNLFECKNCQRVLLEGNVFENQWAGDQANAIVLTPRNANGHCEWCVVADVTFRYNRVTHAAGFLSILGADANSAGGSLGPSQPAQRINVHDNVIEDINNKEWGGGDYSNGKILTIVMGTGSPKIDKFSLVHNTFSGNGSACNSLITFATNSKAVTMTGLVVRDNIFPACKYSISGDYGPDRNALMGAAKGSYIFNNNVFVGWDLTGMSSDLFIPHNAKVSDYIGVGFQNYKGGVGGDYHLSPRSSFRKKASDGKDIGANIDLVNSRTAAAIAGKVSAEVTGSSSSLNFQSPVARLNDPPLSELSVTTGTDKLGNKTINVNLPDYFALQLSDGINAVAGPTSTGLDGFWDLKADPEMKYNLAGCDAGLLSKDFGYPGMFEAKPSGGSIRIIEQNNVRAVVEFTWPVRPYGNNSYPIDPSLNGRQTWTIYRPGKIYERFAFSNLTKTDIHFNYFQYNLHTSWTRFDGEGPTYDSSYWQTLGGYVPVVPSPWGFVGETDSPVKCMLHSRSEGTASPASPTPTYGMVRALNGQAVQVRTSFLEIIAEDAGSYAYSGQLFAGMRSKIQVAATVPPGEDSWVRHLVLLAADDITKASAAALVSGYRNPPRLKMNSRGNSSFDFDRGCYRIVGGGNSLDLSADGQLYYPCFDIADWSGAVPQSISLDGLKTGLGNLVVARVNGHLLLQVQRIVNRGVRVSIS
jgi:hypothetical protein